MDMTPPPADIAFTLDGRLVQAHAGETIWAAAQRHGVEIPHLCHHDPLRPVGNCRACMVEVDGERVLAASCCRTVAPDMKVQTHSARAVTAQRGVLELLVARKPQRVDRIDDELDHWCEQLGADRRRYAGAFQGAQAEAAQWPAPAAGPSQSGGAPPGGLQGQRPSTGAYTPPAADMSHPAISVNLDACILCTRCLRACREEQGNDVIGLAGRGAGARIVFDQAAAMGDSTCVACGECVQACPTGALAPANGAWAKPSARTVDSVCPYCGVGCALTYHIQPDAQGREHIARVDGRDGVANHERLCVKGRFGFDYVANPARLTVPLIRREGVAKDPEQVKLADWRAVFREATWDEALERAAGGLRNIREQHGGRALAGFGSAKGSNEEAYLFQKLVRAGLRTHNVDHCTRLCHASSVAALLEGIGSGAVSNPVMDVLQADVVLLIGANPTVNHPVAASWMKNAMARGTRFILADPRRTELARKAWMTLQFRADTDLALLNAMLHVVFDEDLLDAESVRDRCHPDEVEAVRKHVAGLSPEAMEPVCGVPAADIRAAARAFATSKGSMILWGMGISQHVHGTDNVRALIALCLLTGQIGRPGTGLHPLRGQNNVQGASDAGLIPMMFPDYVRTQADGAMDKAEHYWKLPPGQLSREPGLTVVEIIHAALEGKIRGMYIEGENPAMSDPDVHHARQALAGLEHLVVQDIFLTETAALADVVLPATAWPEKTGTVTNTDRLVQLGRQALKPPGQARADLWIIQEMGRRLGVAPVAEVDMHGGEAGVGAVFEDMRGMMPSIAGISWDRLQREGAVTYPCAEEDQPGQRVVFIDRFPTADGRAKLLPAPLSFADERPDNAYPHVLITGRELEHWHTGAMTRHASVLDALEPQATVSAHPSLLAKLGVAPGEVLRVESRRGAIQLATRADPGMPEDAVFIPFAYAEAAANLLTNAALDPWGKIAEVKYCAVRLSKAEAEAVAAA
ncbi:molybdopterin-dependent oxidoreductase [Thiomonas sp.]|uniref:molybdopterin-dependent oxidoreductase n=1 Tax=Thiomonas sp. TaxID=2047785 RepID=UPI00258471EB|nr:molybdopterin-dependent oxidoreductase [Thiomonas sp.]